MDEPAVQILAAQIGKVFGMDAPEAFAMARGWVKAVDHARAAAHVSSSEDA